MQFRLLFSIIFCVVASLGFAGSVLANGSGGGVKGCDPAAIGATVVYVPVPPIVYDPEDCNLGDLGGDEYDGESNEAFGND